MARSTSLDARITKGLQALFIYIITAFSLLLRKRLIIKKVCLSTIIEYFISIVLLSGHNTLKKGVMYVSLC
jgi:hypothetical protein